MQVTFHGVRGSVPTPGASTVRYGGNTVCAEVRLSDGSLIVLDGGTGMRSLGKKLIEEGFRAPIHVLLTHMHWDHIMGIPFFGPLYQKDTRLVLYPFSWKAVVQSHQPVIFHEDHFPVRFADLPAKIERADTGVADLRIGSARVRRISLNHPGGADGFRIDDDDGASLAYLTDNELVPPGVSASTPADLAKFAEGCGLLIHDAQYLPSDMPAKRGWGHSVVGDVLTLGRDAEVRATALFHHEPERDDDALDRVAAESTEWAKEHAPAMRTLVAREGETLEVPAP